MQTIPLAVIANRWVEAIKDNDRINEFCQAKYGKDLSIFVGYDDAGAPLEEDCPCVIVRGTCGFLFVYTPTRMGCTSEGSGA